MVSLLEVHGSAPREVGARMVILQDGGFTGTIGGGALEWQAIASAQRALTQAVRDGAAPAVRIIKQALGPNLGQCCGGSVRLLVEVFAPARLSEIAPLMTAERGGVFATEGHMEEHRVHRVIVADGHIPDAALLSEQFGEKKQTLALFGAGHVGRALVVALAPHNFKIEWIDSRAGAFPSLIPGDVNILPSLDPVGALAGLPDDTFVLVMSHSHALDLDVVCAALRAGRFAYVGLIGSATKRARFQSRLRQADLSAAEIAKMVCPIGIAGIKSKQPAAIAASVVADLLCRVERWADAGEQDHKVPNLVWGVEGRGT